ncbi:MAG: rhomboid family intramembrane serine protease, partial [Bdellovibrionota bacterium]
FGPPRTPPGVRLVLGICVAVFLAAQVAPVTVLRLALVPALFWRGPAPWQAFTYIFLHFQLWHFVLNALVFWMFGSELERLWGTRKFLTYFLICGVGAGLSSALADPRSGIPIVGASGGIYGLLIAQAILAPERPVLVFLIVPMKMKHFVWGVAAVEFFSQFSGSSPEIAHVAHLGGMAVGYLYLQKDRFFERLRNWYYREKLRRLRERRGEGNGPPPPEL